MKINYALHKLWRVASSEYGLWSDESSFLLRDSDDLRLRDTGELNVLFNWLLLI